MVSGYWDGKPAPDRRFRRTSASAHAEERQRLAASVFDNAHEGMAITDQSGRIVEVNSTVHRIDRLYAGRSDRHIRRTSQVGAPRCRLLPGEMGPRSASMAIGGEKRNRKKTGEIFVEQLTISTVQPMAKSHYVAVFPTSPADRARHQQRLEHLAHFRCADPVAQPHAAQRPPATGQGRVQRQTTTGGLLSRSR